MWGPAQPAHEGRLNAAPTILNTLSPYVAGLSLTRS
jgi:hypothetical protein